MKSTNPYTFLLISYLSDACDLYLVNGSLLSDFRDKDNLCQRLF